MKFSEDVISNFKDYVEKTRREFDYGNIGEAFVHCSLIVLFRKSDDDALRACSVGRGGHDCGIDAFFVEENKKEIFIIQGKFYKTKNTKELLDTLKKAYNALESWDKAASKRVTGIKPRYLLYKKQGYKSKYVFIIFGKLDEKFRKTLHKKVKQEKIGWEIEIYDREDLIKSYNEKAAIPERGPDIKIPIRRKYYFSIEFPSRPRAAIFSIPAYQLVKIVQENRETIFSLNVREYKGEKKTRVNKMILDTLDREKERKYFWFYNLGVTAICDRFWLKRKENQLIAKNFRIINGCQTCNLLAQKINEKNEKEYRDVFVLIRLFELKKELKLARKITVRNNAQNPINARDIMSQDEKQIKLQKELAKMRIFYERRENEWKELMDRQYLYRDVVHSKDAAKAIASFWLGKPAQAKTISNLFTPKDLNPNGLYEEIFDKITPYKLLLAYTIWKNIRNFQSKYKREHRWYKSFIGHADTTITAMFGEIFKFKYRQLEKQSKLLYEKFRRENPHYEDCTNNLYKAYCILLRILNKVLKTTKETPRNYLIRPKSFEEIKRRITKNDKIEICKLLPEINIS